MQTPSETTSAPAAVAAPRTGAPRPRPTRGRLAALGSRLDPGALLPAALVLFFSFQAGGFFPDSTGYAAAGLAVAFALRVTLAERPFAPVGRAAAVVGAALLALLAWTLLSAWWSDAAGRALVEFDRTLLYALAFLLPATFGWDARRLRLAVRAMATALVVVCLAGWSSWVLPEVVEGAAGAATDRLSHPLTYWNAQGLVAALGALCAIHLACSARERPVVRALGAAVVPLLASTLFFTFSRGAFLAVLVGLAVFVVLLRSRALLTGALAVAAPTALAVVVSFRADRLAAADRLDPAAVAQGQDVALAVALCGLGAFLVRLAAARWLDPPLARVALPSRARRPVRAAAIVVALAALVAVPLALDLPGYAGRTYDRFVDADATIVDAELRTRFVNPANNGRIDHWRVALEAWRSERVTGTGAGTYANEWDERRGIDLNVEDGHSLYVEFLADLGLVGFALLVAALATLIAALLWRGLRGRRGPDADRSLDAVVVAVVVAWAVQAGIDWMWELPAVTAPVLALGGLALALPSRSPAGARRSGLGRSARVALGLGCLVLAAIPFQVARSQDALAGAVREFRATPQDCPGAIDRALVSLEAVAARAEPWEIIAYCNVGAGRPDLAVRAATNAVVRDPDNWTYRYALSLVQAVAGEDPRPAARRALALNPRSELAKEAVERFERAPRRRWATIARRLALPST